MEGFRVGELAELAGVSSRVVRLYEQRGLLPEPARTPSGYRVYQVGDLVRLLRVRRLVELGMSLDQARTALAGQDDGDLRGALRRLDDDLAAQQAELRRRRHLLAGLLAVTDGDLAESQRVRQVLAGLGGAAASVQVDGRALARERRALQAVDAVAPAAVEGLAQVYGQVFADPVRAAQAARLGRQFEDLAEPGATTADVDVLVGQALEFLTALGPFPDPRVEGGRLSSTVQGMVREAVEADMAPLQRVFLQQVADRFGSAPDGERR